jgi:hypothetical protein
MDKAKRAHTAETPKQPSRGLKLRAPCLYPDRPLRNWVLPCLIKAILAANKAPIRHVRGGPSSRRQRRRSMWPPACLGYTSRRPRRQLRSRSLNILWSSSRRFRIECSYAWNDPVCATLEGNTTQVVIVGAGFGGLWAAKTLANAPVEVVVIDRQNYHLFQPLLYQVATAGLSPADIAAPIRSIVGRYRNITVMLGTVEGVDVVTREVLIERGRRVRYDYLVLATGARHAYFGHDDWEPFAPQMAAPPKDAAGGLRERSPQHGY